MGWAQLGREDPKEKSLGAPEHTVTEMIVPDAASAVAAPRRMNVQSFRSYHEMSYASKIPQLPPHVESASSIFDLERSADCE